MQKIGYYHSPLGVMLIAADSIGLIGLWFCGQKYEGLGLEKNVSEENTDIIKKTKLWLGIYFKGGRPDFLIPIHIQGTSFQKEVWNHLQLIPYGETRTYSEIAHMIARERGVSKISAQAVGNAVGHNKISIIVPCHRVIGKNGHLTGYAGGLERKAALLKIENAKL